MGIGFAVGWEIVDWGQNDVDTFMAKAVQNGATSVRLSAAWDIIQPTRAAFDWYNHDRVFQSATNAGLNILCLVWARRVLYQNGIWWKKTWNRADPDTPTDFGVFCRRVAQRYPQISQFEIWNEANHPFFWGRTPNAAEYTRYLKSAYSNIKIVRPAAEVVTGATMPLPHSTGTLSPSGFLQGIYQQGGRGYFDSVGNHPYNFDGIDNWGELDRTYQIMRTNGDSAKKILITEVGYPTTRFTAAEQQLRLDDVGWQVAQRPHIDPSDVYIYSLRDSPQYPPDHEQGAFGIYTTDWVKKTEI